VTIHDIIHLLYPQFLPGPLAFLYAQRMIRRALTRGDQIIAGSQNTKTDLMEYFEVDGKKINVVYYGVAKRFSAPLDDETLAARLAPFDLEPGYALFVGNPKPHKNLDNVVKAFARALELTSGKGRLVCVGNRESRDFKIERRAEQLGIADRVDLLGHVDDDTLTALYRGAHLFVYPTLYEGFGLPVVEAMASGVPVITSNSSALKEVAEGYAQLVDPLDIDQMAREIAQCLEDPQHRDALSRLGRRRAEDFLWEKTAERTLEVYSKALGGEL
jgi:glycosyltransferase involved in cell wall biosynthesis